MSYYHAFIHSTTATNPDARKGEVIAYIDGAQDPRDAVAWVDEYMRRNVRDGETRPPVSYYYGDSDAVMAHVARTCGMAGDFHPGHPTPEPGGMCFETDPAEMLDDLDDPDGDDYTPSPHLFDNLTAGGAFRG